MGVRFNAAGSATAVWVAVEDGPAVCKCTAGGASPKRAHSGGDSTGSRLASYTCADTESWAGCWCGLLALAAGSGGGGCVWKCG